jgi:pimeloyl-ACP methyl ester carboxylesterase
VDTQQQVLQLIPTKISVHKKRVNGRTINYVKAGKGPPLLLLHGANIGWAQWYNIVAPLSKKFTVYALDWPGSGYSTKIDYASLNIQTHFLKTLTAFITSGRLTHIRIIAHSISGAVALLYAHAHPKRVEKLILIDSMGFTDYLPIKFYPIAIPFMARFLSSVVVKPTRASMADFLQSVFDKPIPLPDAFAEHFYKSVVRGKITHPLMFIHAITKNFRIRKELLCVDILPSITCPVLVIHGEKDPLIPIAYVRKAVKRLPHGTLKSVARAGHVPSLEQPHIFMREVLRFL